MAQDPRRQWNGLSQPETGTILIQMMNLKGREEREREMLVQWLMGNASWHSAKA